MGKLIPVMGAVWRLLGLRRFRPVRDAALSLRAPVDRRPRWFDR
ncbi:hypothetical protein [Roseomonas populi]|uniref:Uncharacterized protein n=1 Tax=Roseomonas populi TaxID=3121582 RepID=A0ABT1X4U7_9PROT|nr:hypothetical protein [Roseomonas pecuniae]MCR0981964.1 hypothetical protein [Roseomonas pecuniae]